MSEQFVLVNTRAADTPAPLIVCQNADGYYSLGIPTDLYPAKIYDFEEAQQMLQLFQTIGVYHFALVRKDEVYAPFTNLQHMLRTIKGGQSD